MSRDVKKLFGVITCDSQAKWGGPEGIARRVQDLMAEDGEQWKTFVAERGEVPSEEELNTFQGIYISGSKHSVNDEDQQPWVQKLEYFIQQAYKLKRPKVFGTCFGHQLISKALGGKVAKNPSKRFVCSNERILLTRSEEDSGFLNEVRKISKEKSLRILQSHGECVDELPKNARSVAKSATCDNEIVLYSENIIGVQSHPDFYVEDLADIIIPSLLKGKIITEEEYDEANESLMIPNVCADLAKAVGNFLRS